MTQKPQLPLQGIRVLELGHIVAGPSASLILADLGADVIKIEQPTSGDSSRNMPNQGAVYYFLNRNKRSLALNLKTKEGHQIFEKLVKNADVVIDNFAPGGLKRLGIDYDWAKTINPGIIYCSIKGFLSGPDASRPLLDELAQMAAGLAYMTGLRNRPLRAGASIIDIGAASYGVIGILAALYQRTLTGQGCAINSGLFETAVFWVGQHISWATLTNEVPEPMSERAMGGTMGWGVYRLFPTKDGRQIFIAATSNKQWQGLCQALGMDDFLNDESLGNNRKRVAQHERISQRIESIVQTMSFEEVCQVLKAHNVPFAPLNTPKDVLDDEHLLGRRHFVEMDLPDAPGYKAPSLPMEMVGMTALEHRNPPRLGEQSHEILTEIGLSDSEIHQLEQQGIVLCNGKMLKVDTGGKD
jgi:crotonobetainyl-CoA:carnitine CoA-transferase CaiB-like acyl-CoA transferase